MNAVDITTKDPWYTGLMDLPTAGYADGVMDADIKQLATNLKESSNLYNQVQDWTTYISLVGDPAWAGYSKFTPAQQKDYANKAKTVYTDAFNKWMEQAKLPTSVQTILSDDPTAKLPSYLSGYLALDPKDPASVEAYKAQIKKDFGRLKKSNGDPVISNVLIDQVASGKQDFSTLNDIVSQAVTSAVGKELGSAASQISDITKTDAYQNLLSNPSALTSSYNSKVAGLTQDATTGAWAPKTVNTDTSPKPGITSLGPYSGSISDVDTPAKMKQVVDTYDPNKGVYRAPSLDASGNLVSNATSPYSNILNGMLSGYKNPYAAGYTNQLKMPETPNLTNIKKSFENNPTSADLLKLANSAGQPYDPNAKTSLSPALSKMYQPSVINSAGQPAKPGAPDTTSTTLPVVPKPGGPIVTDTGKVVNPPVVKPPVKTAAELAAEKFVVDKASYMNSFNAKDYIDPLNRTRPDILALAKTDPKLAANLDWSAQLDQSPADFKSKVGMTPAEIAANKTQSTTTPAPFTVTPQTSYSPADYSPELKAALAARASTDAQNVLVGDTITANEKAKGIISPNVSNTVSTGNMNTYATGPNGEAGIPSALTTTPQFTSGDYIPPANRAVPTFANNPALADQIAWSATQDAAQAKQAAPAVGINTLPNSTGATGTTTPAPFTVNSTTSYSSSDYSPELKAALAARAASMGK